MKKLEILKITPKNPSFISIKIDGTMEQSKAIHDYLHSIDLRVNVEWDFGRNAVVIGGTLYRKGEFLMLKLDYSYDDLSDRASKAYGDLDHYKVLEVDTYEY